MAQNQSDLVENEIPSIAQNTNYTPKIFKHQTVKRQHRQIPAEIFSEGKNLVNLFVIIKCRRTRVQEI